MTAATDVSRRWPEPVAAEAFHGLAGDIVAAIAPRTEADPVAILSQFLVAFGNVVGRQAYYPVEADHHRANEYVVLVGPSAKGRKGSSWSQVKRIITTIDSAWAETRIVSGLSSGEGLIWQVRDEVEVFDRRAGEKKVVADAVEDKRTMVVENEFAIVLRQLVREGNTLSAVIRNAWDSEVLQALTKNSPARATGSHVSIIGHITADELIRYIDATELANGFLNRFMLFAVKRAQLLPEGEASKISTGLRSRTSFGARWTTPRPQARCRGTGPPGSDGMTSTRRCPRVIRAFTAPPPPEPRPTWSASPCSTRCSTARRRSLSTTSWRRWRCGITHRGRHGGSSATAWGIPSPTTSGGR